MGTLVMADACGTKMAAVRETMQKKVRSRHLRVSCLVGAGRDVAQRSPSFTGVRRGETWQIGDAYQGMDLTMTTLPADDVAFDAEAYKLAIKQMRKVRHTSAGDTNIREADLPHSCS